MNELDANKYLFTLSRLGLKNTLKLSLGRLCSVNHFYILKRNLVSLFNENKTRLAITVNKINCDDVSELVRTVKSLDRDSKREVVARLLFYKAGFKNCYVAKTRNDEIAYLQWLVYPTENALIKKYYPNTFYGLRKNQVMVENAFTFPRFRGLGLMPAVTLVLLNIAKEDGYKSAIGYIRKDKIASLNEFVKLGFKITKIVKEYKVVGITKRSL